MHIFRESLVYVMWESSFVVNSNPHTKDHKIWPSLMLLMSSFSVFDSKGGEVVGPKASPTHNKTKSKIHIFLKIPWYKCKHSIGIKHTSGLVMGRSKGRTPFGNDPRKGGKWIMELGEAYVHNTTRGHWQGQDKFSKINTSDIFLASYDLGFALHP